MTEGKYKEISERVSFLKTNTSCKVIIRQQIGRVQESLLFAWIVAWAVCGAVFSYYYFTSIKSDERMFLLVSLAFWSFFMFRIGKVYLWRKMGREIIHIEAGKMTVQMAFGKRGKVQHFQIRNISSFGVIKLKESNFLQSLDQSFWVIGGDRFGFNYMDRKYRFGKQLSDKEVRSLGQVIEKSLRVFGNG